MMQLKVWHFIPDRMTGFPNSFSTMVLKEVKLKKSSTWIHKGKDLLTTQVYINDIICEAIFEVLCEDVIVLMGS